MKIHEIANFVKGNLIGDGELEISRVASLEKAKSGEISFINKSELADKTIVTNASCVFAAANSIEKLSCPIIQVKNPKLAFAKIAEVLHPNKARKPDIHQSSVVSKLAKIGKDVFIGAHCSVGENSEIGNHSQLLAGTKIGNNVKVGKNCIFHPNVFIEDGCTIGDNVILYSGAVIGKEGFGFVRDVDKHVKFPQIGTVIIEDDVEIGANSCVDRGALGETRIGKGTKIDNLVQVAHNVNIGERVVIAAQTGISGSVTIEDDCIIAGQVGFADHTTIKKGAIIGAKSAVFPGKIVREGIWCGIPVQPIDDYKRQNANIKAVPRLRKEIKILKTLIKELENK